MFGAKYSRLKFWIWSIILLIPFSFISVFVKATETSIELADLNLFFRFLFLLVIVLWMNSLANRIRDYGSNPWISLFALIPLVNVGLALYYGIARSKNKPEYNENIKNDETSLTKAVINHSKDIASEIKPAINEYKEKHSSLKTTAEERPISVSNNSEMNEDEIYEQIMIEIEEDKKVKSTWAKALAQSDGDRDKAESLYINFRFLQVYNDLMNLNNEKKDELVNLNKNNVLETENREIINKEYKLNKYLSDKGMRLISEISENEVIACFFNSPIDVTLEFIDDNWHLLEKEEKVEYLKKIDINILNKNEMNFLNKYHEDIKSPFVKITEYEIIVNSREFGLKKYKRK